jgi:hypothetical protein
MKTVKSMLAEAEAEVPRIGFDEARGLPGRADVLFLDVREPAEVAASGRTGRQDAQGHGLRQGAQSRRLQGLDGRWRRGRKGLTTVVASACLSM